MPSINDLNAHSIGRADLVSPPVSDVGRCSHNDLARPVARGVLVIENFDGPACAASASEDGVSGGSILVRDANLSAHNADGAVIADDVATIRVKSRAVR